MHTEASSPAPTIHFLHISTQSRRQCLSTSVKAAIPRPGQPNRSTGFLYRLNIVADCDVAECGRPEPVCVITLQRLKRNMPCLVAKAILQTQAQLLSSLGRKALNTSRRLAETHGLTNIPRSSPLGGRTATPCKRASCLTTAPYVPSVQREGTAQISGARETSAQPRTVDLATTWDTSG
jgi:hypothetical protein